MGARLLKEIPCLALAPWPLGPSAQHRCSSSTAIRQAALVAQALMAELKLMRSAWSFQASRPNNLGMVWNMGYGMILGGYVEDM